jgi:hypothetical protein
MDAQTGPIRGQGGRDGAKREGARERRRECQKLHDWLGVRTIASFDGSGCLGLSTINVTDRGTLVLNPLTAFP